MDKLRDALRGTIQQALSWPAGGADELAEYAHIVTYEKKRTVFCAGQPSDLLHLLISGEVRLYYGDPAGCRLLVSIVRGGDTLGTGDLQSGDVQVRQQEQCFTAQAAEHSKIAVFVRARVADMLRRLPSAELVCILERNESRWKALCGRLVAFMTQSVPTRLAYSIMEMARDFGIADARGTLITLRLSHEDFAEMIGASRPMVSKCLHELARAKIFVKQGGRYILQRADLLATMVDGSSHPEPLSHLVASDLRFRRGQRPTARMPLALRRERGLADESIMRVSAS